MRVAPKADRRGSRANPWEGSSRAGSSPFTYELHEAVCSTQSELFFCLLAKNTVRGYKYRHIPRSSRPVDPIPPWNMQRGLVALGGVLFRLKECGPECNRLSPFLIHISSMLAITRETDATESGTRI